MLGKKTGYGQQKKKQSRKSETVEFFEPYRKSVYEMLLENMQFLQRSIYVHRLIYIGTHNFIQTEAGSIGKFFRANIDRVNATYNEEYLTGFLVYYTRHFIHVIEGSEDSLKKHLDMLFEDNNIKDNLETVKVLTVYHNINKRCLSNWTELSAKPPQLLQKIKSDIDVAEARSKILMCITKIYKIFEILNAAVSEEYTAPSQPDMALYARSSKAFHSTVKASEDLLGRSRVSLTQKEQPSKVSMTRIHSVVPELQLMEFLVETPHTQDIQVFRNCYGSIPLLYSYDDECFPVKTDFIPRNIFDLEYDPVTDLCDSLGSMNEETENI